LVVELAGAWRDREPNPFQARWSGTRPLGNRDILMSGEQLNVHASSELLAAVADKDVRQIAIAADLSDLPMLRLLPGQMLSAANEKMALYFASGEDGVQLSTNNQVENLYLHTDQDRRALFNDTSVDRIGCFLLRHLSINGVVQLLAREQVRGGYVEVDELHIEAADARNYEERPKGYGVEVIPGAFTLWNQQDDPNVTITADITGVSAGHDGAPVRGSGIFISGAGDTGGRLIARRLETGAVYSDGGIAPGTPDRISGGIFVVSGAFADSVRSRGPVTTYGANDMVLDNWGVVDRWTAEKKITSHGASGIGFVNFGIVNTLVVNAAIETFGQGARGFNVYAGTVHTAQFERIVTHANGAVGIQISQPVGKIRVRRGIETFGGTGDSLVKGVVLKLSAIALSIKPGGGARKVEIAGGLITHGRGVTPMEIHGAVSSLQIADGLTAAGGGFDKI
jgi:hypothetical protein